MWDNKYGIVSVGNETKLDFTYTYIKYIQEADFIQAQKEDGQSDLIDRNFNIKVTGIVSEINQDKNYIKVRVSDEYKYYNFKLEEKKAQGISKKQQNKQVISCHVTAYTVGDAYTPSDTMANGEKVHVGAVASYDLPLGTKVRINGVVYTVKDRCGVPNTIDIYMNSKQECMRFGKRYMNVEIL